MTSLNLGNFFSLAKIANGREEVPFTTSEIIDTLEYVFLTY